MTEQSPDMREAELSVIDDNVTTYPLSAAIVSALVRVPDQEDREVLLRACLTSAVQARTPGINAATAPIVNEILAAANGPSNNNAHHDQPPTDESRIPAKTHMTVALDTDAGKTEKGVNKIPGTMRLVRSRMPVDKIPPNLMEPRTELVNERLRALARAGACVLMDGINGDNYRLMTALNTPPTQAELSYLEAAHSSVPPTQIFPTPAIAPIAMLPAGNVM